MKIANHRLYLDEIVPARYVASPNHEGPLKEKAFIIMHYTNGPSLSAAVGWLTNRASQVSAHVIIGRDGQVVQLIPFDTIGWHAGQSEWGGYSRLNGFSVGIELDNAGMLKRTGNQWVATFGAVYPDSEVMVAPHKSFPDVQYGWHTFSEIQVKTAARVAAALIQAYGFREILGHDDIAPKRKWDPGPAFPMEQFKEEVAALVSGETLPDPKPNPSPDPKPDPRPDPNPDPKPEQGMKLMRYKVENLDTNQSVEYKWGTAFKPVVLLPVPYVSQLGSGADAHSNDCGAASAVMLLGAYFNLQMTPDEFYTRFAIAGDPFLSVGTLRNAMGGLGLLTDFRASLTVQDLFAAMAAGKPAIVLMRYKILEEAGLTEKNFEGPHFAVVVGMDVRNIYIHDPLFSKPEDGNARAYPLDLFWKAWKDVPNDPKFPGPERGAIIPTAGIGFRLARSIKVNQAVLNIRSGAGANFPVVGTAKRGEVFEVTREMSGWGQIGDNRWISLTFTLPA